MDDIDFKAKVTRAEFEQLCADLFERVPRPVQDALTTAEMNLVSILIACLFKFYKQVAHDKIIWKLNDPYGEIWLLFASDMGYKNNGYNKKLQPVLFFGPDLTLIFTCNLKFFLCI